MSNVFTDIGHGLKVAGEDVAKVAEDIVTVGGKVIKVIEDAKVLTPAFKAELSTLIDDAKALATPLAPVLASGGANVAIDVTALEPVVSDVVKLVKDFISFLPTIDAALKQIGADVTGAASASAPATN